MDLPTQPIDPAVLLAGDESRPTRRIDRDVLRRLLDASGAPPSRSHAVALRVRALIEDRPAAVHALVMTLVAWVLVRELVWWMM